ncbi:V-type ATP synthase subunit F [Alkalibaculum bacchi]|uniref:V-type ATP synthase subunit F n=1 Tax=Alkalibaculum bacchi TaxID=645887 RepID=UPI0026EAE5F2|nr:V-type ATP synthase subunit F [Alkalibaculum bacchi]
MKSFLLSDNRDTYIGMKLVGIDGVYLQKGDDVLESYRTALISGYGIIFITEKIYHQIKEEVMKTKTTKKIPLITVIPDRHGYANDKEKITSYIKESIGI